MHIKQYFLQIFIILLTLHTTFMQCNIEKEKLTNKIMRQSNELCEQLKQNLLFKVDDSGAKKFLEEIKLALNTYMSDHELNKFNLNKFENLNKEIDHIINILSNNNFTEFISLKKDNKINPFVITLFLHILIIKFEELKASISELILNAKH